MTTTATPRFITPDQRLALVANGQRSARGEEIDPHPVLKLFLPGSSATWLLTEIDPVDHDLTFGLCDLGLGCPELGYVSISELSALRSRLGLPVEQDLSFVAHHPLSHYARLAQETGWISA